MSAESAGGETELLYLFADSLQPAEEEQEPEEPESWVAFRLAGAGYALPVSHVERVVRVGEITRVPRAPASVQGVTNLRGRVIPVVDLRRRLGLPAGPPPDAAARILVLGAQGRRIGLLVDAAEHVLRLLPSRRQAPGSALPPAVMASYPLEGETLRLLDPERLLAGPAPAAREDGR